MQQGMMMGQPGMMVGAQMTMDWSGNVVVQPEIIPLQAPMGVAFLPQPQMYNGIPYYWHHGHWWRQPHTHSYFSHPTFMGWYQQRFGTPYQGLNYVVNSVSNAVMGGGMGGPMAMGGGMGGPMAMGGPMGGGMVAPAMNMGGMGMGGMVAPAMGMGGMMGGGGMSMGAAMIDREMIRQAFYWDVATKGFVDAEDVKKAVKHAGGGHISHWHAEQLLWTMEGWQGGINENEFVNKVFQYVTMNWGAW